MFEARMAGSKAGEGKKGGDRDSTADPKKLAAKKKAGKKAVTKKAATKKTATKKTVTKKAATKKTAASKTASKNVVSRKAGSKKASAKKVIGTRKAGSSGVGALLSSPKAGVKGSAQDKDSPRSESLSWMAAQASRAVEVVKEKQVQAAADLGLVPSAEEIGEPGSTENTEPREKAATPAEPVFGNKPGLPTGNAAGKKAVAKTAPSKKAVSGKRAAEETFAEETVEKKTARDQAESKSKVVMEPAVIASKPAGMSAQDAVSAEAPSPAREEVSATAAVETSVGKADGADTVESLEVRTESSVEATSMGDKQPPGLVAVVKTSVDTGSASESPGVEQASPRTESDRPAVADPVIAARTEHGKWSVTRGLTSVGLLVLSLYLAYSFWYSGEPGETSPARVSSPGQPSFGESATVGTVEGDLSPAADHEETAATGAAVEVTDEGGQVSVVETVVDTILVTGTRQADGSVPLQEKTRESPGVEMTVSAGKGSSGDSGSAAELPAVNPPPPSGMAGEDITAPPEPTIEQTEIADNPGSPPGKDAESGPAVVATKEPEAEEQVQEPVANIVKDSRMPPYWHNRGGYYRPGPPGPRYPRYEQRWR